MFFVLSEHNELVISREVPNDKKEKENIEYVNHDIIIREFYFSP